MSIYDILMLVVLVDSILFGLWKGLAWQVASLASIFVSYFVALNFRGALSGYITAAEPWNQFAAMLILFLGTSLIIWLAYGYLKATIERWKLRGFDTQAGGIVGAVKGVLLCMLITLFAVTLFGENVREAVVASRSGSYITGAINGLNTMVPDEIHAVLNDQIQKFNQQLDETSPGFVEKGHEKLQEKLKTIRGKFSVPTGEQRLTNSPNDGFQTGNDSPPPSGINLEELQQQSGNPIRNATNESGRTVVDENFNR